MVKKTKAKKTVKFNPNPETWEELRQQTYAQGKTDAELKRFIQIYAYESVSAYVNTGRMEYADLKSLAAILYRSIILLDSRCAAIQNICNMMYSLGMKPEIIGLFIRTNIEAKTDCGICTLCRDNEKNGSGSIMAITHAGTDSVH